MKIIQTNNFTKIASKTKRKKRDGTGPFENSLQNEIEPKGKRKQKEKKYPLEDKEI